MHIEKDQTSHFSDLEDLEDKLRSARQTSKWSKRPTAGKRPPSALGTAFRVATELVVSVGFGVFIGWGLDKWLGTSPWFLLVFIFLGMAAGILNVYRIASPGINGPADPANEQDD